jgi:prephenate dehydrogenase
VRWRKVAILGVGLLGGSLGLALRRRGLAGEVVGFVRREATAREAIGCGAVDSAGTKLTDAVRGADLVVLCTPVAQMAALTHQIRDYLEEATVLTDVGSVKGAVVEALNESLGEVGGRFHGSHPMAGSERVGVAAARADLFDDAVTVVTPTVRTSERATRAITGLWESVGSRVLSMTPERHDALVGRSSHLPHLVAVALARCVLAPARAPEIDHLCASGFRDTTRVASGSTEMWRDISLANRAVLLAALDEFQEEMASLRARLERANVQEIEEFLREAKERRDAWKATTRCPDGE